MTRESSVELMMGKLKTGYLFYLIHTMVIIVCTFSYSAIKVWDFQAALDPRTPADALCLRTLVVRGFL